jgi:SagB-type dehydrogenase family enzyme
METKLDPTAQTVRWGPRIFGEHGIALDDPTEAFHEETKIYPSTIGRQLVGGGHLAADEHLQLSSLRSVLRRPQLPAVELPPPELPQTPIADAIVARRSIRSFGPGSLTLDQVATLLHAAYGVTHTLDRPDGTPAAQLRAVPSGGALYPLELYVLAARVDGLEPGLYHFDPLRRVLEVVRVEDPSPKLLEISTYPEIVGESAVTWFVTLVVWRTRFKYGPRGYRFALLEAGHLAQNLVLTATALGLAAVPLGGFYDRRADEYLGIDGVHESTIYTLSAGTLPSETT